MNLLPSQLFDVDETGNPSNHNRSDIRGEGMDEPQLSNFKREASSVSSSQKEYKFLWKYKNGFAENFDKIFEEFKVYREIKTFKVVFAGLPFLGKTYFAQK